MRHDVQRDGWMSRSALQSLPNDHEWFANGKFCSCKFTRQEKAVEDGPDPRDGAAGAVRCEKFRAIFPEWLAEEHSWHECGGAVCGDVLCDAQVQPGVFVLHAEGARRI